MASGVRRRYPYLSDKDWEKYKDKPEKLESISDFRKDELVDKLANFSLSEKTFNVKIPCFSTDKDELRIVIIGKTGQGKSATANTILGKTKFIEDFTAKSVTQESRCITELLDERKISVMDTPGLQDTHTSNESILREIARMTILFPDGVHAFVYVMNMADPRFTAEDKKVLDLIENTFGGGFKNYCLLVFSHGDAELKDVDLDTYREKQMEIGMEKTAQPYRNDTLGDKKGKTEEEHDHRGLAIFLKELSWKIVAIDNKTSIPFERNHSRGRIIAMIDEMRKRNRPDIYTNDMFTQAQEEREAMRLKGLKRGWHPSVMSIVERIIAANPQINRKALQQEVRKEMENQNLQKMILLKKKEEEFEKRRIIAEKRLEEQKQLNAEKRQAEENERKKRQQIEAQERKERIRKEEQARQERRKQEERERQSKQEQYEREKQEQLQREEIARQGRLDEEEYIQRQRLQNEKEEWEKHNREEQDEFERQTNCRQRQQDMWETQLREDQQRQEREEDKFRRYEEEEIRRAKQIEREDIERQERRQHEEMELSERLAQRIQEESERQMTRAQEDVERREQQEREWKQREQRQLEEGDEWEIQRDEIERRRQEILERDEMERQQRIEREDMEIARQLEREEYEREEAERERERRAEEELQGLREEIEDSERLQTGRRLDDQVSEIEEEHNNVFEVVVGTVVNTAKKVVGWFKGLF